MEPDLNDLRRLGDALAPPTGPPPELRQRVLSPARASTALPRSRPPSRRPSWRPVWATWRPRWQPSWRLTTAVATAVAAAAAMLAVALTGAPQDEFVSPPINPSIVLARAVYRAAAGPRISALPGQLVFTESTVIYMYLYPQPNYVLYTSPLEVRRWVSVDGSGPGLEQTRPAELPAAPWSSDPISGCTQYCVLDPRYRDLPTDPDAMHAFLYRPGGGEYADGAGPELSTDLRALGEAAYILDLVPYRPDVHAAVLGAIARIPQIKVEPRAVDVSGRAGVGVVYQDGTNQTELIFDAKTYAYLGMKRTLQKLLKLPVQVGATPIRVVVAEAVRSAQIVDEIGETR